MNREKLSQLIENSHLRAFIRVVEFARKPIDPEDVEYVKDVFKSAEFIVAQMENIEPNLSSEKTGGIMVIAKDGENSFVAVNEVRQIKTDSNRSAATKRDKFTKFCLAKTAMLLAHPELTASSKNIDLPQDEVVKYFDSNDNPIIIPAGAIRIGKYVVGFSSFMAQDDESVVIASQVKSARYSIEESLILANQIGNSRYPQIYEQLM